MQITYNFILHTFPLTTSRFLSPSLPLDPSLLADYIGELEGLKDWRRLALKLGFSFEEVKKIKEDNKGQQEDCILEVMSKWLQREPISTTAVLIQALKGIQEYTIAARLREGEDSCYSKQASNYIAFTSAANVVSVIVHESG